MRTLNALAGGSPPGTPKPTSASDRAQSKQRKLPANTRNDSRLDPRSMRCLTATGRWRYPRPNPLTSPTETAVAPVLGRLRVVVERVVAGRDAAQES